MRNPASFIKGDRSGSRWGEELWKLAAGDRGVAYSLSFAITLPFYALLIGFLVEVALMLNVHVGMDYAAWSAARAASVWIPAEQTKLTTGDVNADMVRRAAVNAISAWSNANAVAPVSSADRGAQAILDGYKARCLGARQSDMYVLRKWNYANSATRVEFDPPLQQLLQPRPVTPETVRVTVHYEMPFNLPGIGRLLGRRGRNGWVRDLKATAELRLERPLSTTGRMGIEYDSHPAR
jgi:Flp pilus assembly protein TadG